MTATIAERVAAGVDFLDERAPGWEDRIDLSVLDIFSLSYCVIGQLDRPSYLISDDDLSYDPSLGFDAADYVPGHGDVTEAECAELTAEWKRVITSRRS